MSVSGSSIRFLSQGFRQRLYVAVWMSCVETDESSSWRFQIVIHQSDLPVLFNFPKIPPSCLLLILIEKNV